MNILFLCVANSARSQIAEGIARKILGPSFNVQSAGSNPSGEVHPLAIQVLKELGVDTRKHKSKSLNSLEYQFLKNIDYVITLCAEEFCPSLNFFTKKIHWPISDPSNGDVDDFRATRDIVMQKIIAQFAFQKTNAQEMVF